MSIKTVAFKMINLPLLTICLNLCNRCSLHAKIMFWQEQAGLVFLGVIPTDLGSVIACFALFSYSITHSSDLSHVGRELFRNLYTDLNVTFVCNEAVQVWGCQLFVDT